MTSTAIRKLWQGAALISLALSLSSCHNKQHADLLITNATIYTLDSTNSIAEAMAISEGKVLATGSSEEILSHYRGPVKDMQGHALYPGFRDAHCHFYAYGLQSQRYCDLRGTNSWKQVLDRLQAFEKKHPGRQWILGRGWDQNDWPQNAFPHRRALDSLFPDKMVLLTRIDGHAIIVNNKVLELAGLNEHSRIDGGQLIQQEGQLSGVLLDNAADRVRKLIPAPDSLEINQALLKAQSDCFAVGLTSVMDAGLNRNIIEAIKGLIQQGKLKMRIDAMLSPTAENIESYVKKGVYRSPYLHIHSIKLYADGALGSRGACLLSPYHDAPESYGFLVSSPSYIDSLCSLAYCYSYQVNTHAIGDSAVRLVLDIYARHLKGPNDRRWRIEHSQVVAPQDLPRYGRYQVIPAVNTTHATSDMYWAEKRLGSQRLPKAYAYRQLLEQNGWLTNGSDFPIENINPLYGFYAAVARKDLQGYPNSGFLPENALTRQQALKAMTLWAAKGSFEEKETGSLEKGKNADFVVTQRDVMTCPEEVIATTEVLMTFVGGKPVYQKP